MSKINAVRFINLNYNNNSIKISDETFQMQGRTTLMSLRNGGGKSVMVQMMIAPFVHQRYRRTPDRPFESFFTTSKPSFILVEWKLDQGAGYCLTGMMVRKNQNTDDKNETANDNALEMINFIAEYKGRCEYDIYNLPVVVREAKEINLKSFRECRMLFENYKKDKNIKFNYYDMYSDASSRQYFSKLEEYRIYYREWESIVKKVNIEESGLSKLFADCKDEKNLIEKWFLDAVENKLDENGRLKGYKEMVTKYVTQYNANRSQMNKRDCITEFCGDIEPFREKAAEYSRRQENEDERRFDIAYYIAELEIFNKFLTDENSTNNQKITDKAAECSDLELKEASLQIHSLLDEQKIYAGDMELSKMESNSLQQRVEQKEHEIHILECADQNKKTNEEEAEFRLASEKRRIALKTEKNLEPERRSIGGRLKKYYLMRGEEINGKLSDVEERINDNADNLKRDKNRRDSENDNIRRLTGIIGKLSGEAEHFDRTEQEFNREFNENFSRLITGEYTPGFIQITGERYEKEGTEAVRKLEQSRRTLDVKQGTLLAVEKRTDDLKKEESGYDTEIGLLEERISVMKREIDDRSRIIRYLNVPDSKLWKRDEIIQAAERRCSEIDAIRKDLERRVDGLQKEYKSLSSGQTVELSDEMKEYFTSLGIQPVYGLEWLSKNGFDEKRNLELVKKNPFIPYALILTQKQLQRLMNSSQNGIFTSFPIPILEREKLETAVISSNSGLVSFEGIHFYMLFNNLLLNAEELKRILSAKTEEIKRLEEEISGRSREYDQTMERKSCIMNQSVTKENYDAACFSLEENRSAKKETAALIEKSKAERDRLEKEIADINILIRDCERNSYDIQRKKERFTSFSIEYSEYLLKKEEKSKAEAERNRSQGMYELLNTNIADEEELAVELESRRRDIRVLAGENNNHLGLYDEYDEADATDDEKEILQLEVRYTAISAEFSKNVNELEERYMTSKKRYQKEKQTLDRMLERFSVSTEEIEGREYDEEEFERLEREKKRLTSQKNLKDDQYHNAEKKYARLDGQISDRRKALSDRFKVKEPVPKSEIPLIDYSQAINIIKNEIRTIDACINVNKEHQNSIKSCLTTLSEYNDGSSTVMDRPEFREKYYADGDDMPDADKIRNSDIFCMQDTALREKTGMLIRDLKNAVGEKKQVRDHAEKELRRIMGKEIYREEDFSACMEILCESLEEAATFTSQLDVVLKSFDAILKKLEVDLAIIERERREVEGLLIDYVREVHANLGMIDGNSTITIRNRPIRMLRLNLPDWETNEQLYELRLHDYIQEITEKSLEIFDKNELPTDFIGTRITTKALYDVIVGVGNIQIKLYKIEAEREYPITWNEASRNSGGEGFLSAFVILSCLLYYMRKDDMDLFSEKNEGKVLIMDNPFAQTNAPHLLKPLMEMAKKTNTQLICLTGLGGDAIYSCFDNIYALKLVAASMRNGLEYMKSEHIRGNEEQTIVASHLEVNDQMSFLF